MLLHGSANSTKFSVHSTGETSISGQSIHFTKLIFEIGRERERKKIEKERER